MTCIITNILSPKVKVEVEKSWNDGKNKYQTRPKSIIMQLQYKNKVMKNSVISLEIKGVLILDGIVDEDQKSKYQRRYSMAWCV